MNGKGREHPPKQRNPIMANPSSLRELCGRLEKFADEADAMFDSVEVSTEEQS